MTELTERCLELPYKERVELCSEIRQSILREWEEQIREKPGRGVILLGYMGEILGEPIPVSSRESRFVWARTMVAFQLLKEGYTTTEVGRMIGRDHSSVTSMRHRMQDALDYSFAYKDIIHIWKQFQNKLQDEIHRGTTENPVGLGG